MNRKRHVLFVISGFILGLLLVLFLPSERLSITGSGQVIANMSYNDEK